MSLIAELKRRNVFRVVIAYLLGSWVLLQVADVLFGVLQLPEWSLTLVAAILALGFIPAVIVSWIYELTPDGLMRDQGAEFATPMRAQTSRKLDVAIVGLFVVTIALLGWQLFSERPAEPSSPTPAAVAETPGPPPDAPSDRSIAVLPFANLSSDVENEYFADGLSEELLNVLAKVDGLKVAGRTSSFFFKGKNEDLKEIGEKLGVANILEGSVRKQGDQIRVTAQLIKVDDGFHLWSENYDRTLDDIFAIQDDIAQAVVGELVAAILGTASAPTEASGLLSETPAGAISTARDVDPRIYARYLEARARQNKRTLEDTRIARDMFRAITLEAPGFEPGWTGLATSVLLLSGNHGVLSLADAQREAEEATQRALALDPDSAGAWATRGWIAQGQFRPNSLLDATAAFERATRLDPNLTEAWYWLAASYESLFRSHDAVEAYQRALAIDPLARVPALRLPKALMVVGEKEQSDAAARFIVETFGSYNFTDLNLSLRAEVAGQADAAYGYMRRAFEVNPADGLSGLFAAFLAEQIGDREAAIDLLDEIESPARMVELATIWQQVLTGDLAGAISRAEALGNPDATTDPGTSILLELLLAAGRNDEAVALIEQRSRELAADSPAVGAGNVAGASWAALALRRVGRIETSELLIDRALEVLEPAREGAPLDLDPTTLRLALLATGERFSELTVEATAAVDRNLRLNRTSGNPWTFETDPRFAAAMGHPPFVAVVDRIKASSAAALARFEAGETELLTP